MKAANSHVRLQDPPTEFRDQLRPDLPDLLVVILVWLERVQVRLWDFRLRETRRPVEPIPRLDRVNARDDGNSDPRRADLLDPLDEHVDVVEHLCKNEVHARVDFLLEELHLTSTFFGRQELVLRETCDGNVEVVAVLFTDMADEVDTVGETTFDNFPFVLSLWWISTKGKDVTAAELFRVLEEVGVGNFSRVVTRREWEREKKAGRTRRAMSTFSLGMFVQVRCMHVSIPIKLWHVFTSSEVRSDVRPPAFLHFYLFHKSHEQKSMRETHQVISMNSGPSWRIRSIRSRRFCKPWIHMHLAVMKGHEL